MVDDLDLSIIQVLEQDGRMRYVDIAEKMGVTEGTIRIRIRKLLNDKVINIQARPDPMKIGFNVIAIMGLQVRLSAIKDVAKILIAKPNVQWLASVAGKYNMMAMIITESNYDLSCFIEDEIASISDISSIETFVNLDIQKGMMADTASLIEKVKHRFIKRSR